MLYLTLAWRNIWRNKRRTFITVLSMFVAVALAIFMRSQQMGSYELMIRNTAGSYTGHIQIHQKGFWEEQNLDNSMEENLSFSKKILKYSQVKAVIPRLESYALLSGQEKSRAGLIVGMDPAKERALSNPEKYLSQGESLDSVTENAAMIGERLAKFLDIQVGDSIVVIGQGFQGMSAVGKYPVKGILKFPSPEMSKSMLYLPLATAQELFAAYDRLTALCILTDQPKKVTQTTQILKKYLPAQTYEIMSWKEMMPEMVQMIQSDDIGGQIMIGILYMVVGFGIFGTIIMMTTERRYEFGVLIGIGMRRWKLGNILLLETMILAIIAASLGSACIAPVIWYLHEHPVRLTGDVAMAIEEMGYEPMLLYSMNRSLFINQSMIIVFITFLAALYPVWLTRNIEVVKAMRD